MDANKTNNLSSKLREEIRKAQPKPGTVVWFTSTRPKARGTTVLSLDRIFDPWASSSVNDKGETEYVGAYVDIAHVTGQEPGKTPGSTGRDIIGRIQFRRSDQGKIPVRGGNRADELLFQYLFLTNQNKTNLEKPWFVSTGRGFAFEMDEPSKKASELLASKRNIRAAGNAIDEMADSELLDFAMGLDMSWVTPSTQPDEIRVALLRMAEVESGALKILNIDKDIALKAKIDIKKAEKAGIIKNDSALKTWSWSETGDTIVSVPPGQKPVDVLVSYLLGKGSDVYKFIKLQLEKDKPPKPKKDQSPDKK